MRAAIATASQRMTDRFKRARDLDECNRIVEDVTECMELSAEDSLQACLIAEQAAIAGGYARPDESFMYAQLFD